MYTEAEILALKTANQVQTAIDNNATPNPGVQPYVSPTSSVASDLGLKRWLVVRLRQLYNKTRI
jgi:hypothetical protein